MNTLTNLNTFPIGNSLDGINIITEEINTLSLLVDGTNYMLADLNMDNHNIKNLDAGVNGTDAVNKNQLDLKADLVYVDTSLNSLRSYTDASLNSLRSYTDASLNSLRSYTDVSLNDLRNYTDSSLNLLREYTDASLNDLRSYTDSSLNSLREYTDASLNSLRSYTDTSLNLLREYTDASLNDLREYTDASLNDLKTYIISQDDTKVNKSGDTMTGDLTLNNSVLNLNGGTASDATADFKTNTYIRFGEAGSSSDWAYLRQIGGNNDIKLALDFHDNGTDGELQLRSINSIANPDTYTTFFTANSSGITVPNVLANAGMTISRAGTTTDAEQPFRLQKNNNYIGMNSYFSPGSYNGLVGSGDKGIIFSDNSSYNTSSGLVIAPHNNTSTGIRIDNNGLTVGGTITRNAWSSGELIKSLAYNYYTENRSGVQQISANSTAEWNISPVIYSTQNTSTTNVVLTIKIDASYHLSGQGQDGIEIKVYDVTDRFNDQIILRKVQYYDGNGGGGTRSGPILPLVASYTPAYLTFTQLRKIQVDFINRSNDTLHICKGVVSGSIVDLDYYTVEINEYKL